MWPFGQKHFVKNQQEAPVPIPAAEQLQPVRLSDGSLLSATGCNEVQIDYTELYTHDGYVGAGDLVQIDGTTYSVSQLSINLKSGNQFKTVEQYVAEIKASLDQQCYDFSHQKSDNVRGGGPQGDR